MRLLILWAAAAVMSAQTVRITETAGLARVNEPVVCMVDGTERTLFVTIGANQSRTFAVAALAAKEPLRFTRGEGEVGFRIANSQFAADLTKRMWQGREEDSGQIRSLTYRGVSLLRTQNRMHWAPSFQRQGARGYTSIAMWSPVQLHEVQESGGAVTFTREGHTADYPEIRLWAEYRFFAHVPYFMFKASMDIVQPMEMFWLRSQEMTMDAFFTHVAWPRPDGRAEMVTFDKRQPLAVDVPWVAFLNPEKGYGIGAVILSMTATTLVKAKTSINDGAENGKYWDRHLISQTRTALKVGDRYTEHTAYVLFETLKDFLDWEARLRNPLRVVSGE